MLVECVICYENLQSSEAIYHTPCGHVFHHACLTRWFKRSKTCPECREKIPERKISRLYLNFVNSNPPIDAAIVSSLQTQISGLNHELLIKELEIIESNSNNSKLSALLKSKDSEIVKLQASLQIDRNVWKTHMEGQKRELEALKKDIARVTKERNDMLSSNRSWEKLSQMFHGITDHNALIDTISVMISELATCTSSRWELKKTIIELRQELAQRELVDEARLFFASDRTKKREMESSVASLEIEKTNLLRELKELLNMMDFGVKPDNFVRQQPLPKLSVAAYNSVPFKKRKVETTEKLSGIAGEPATPIDVIDLTVEPVRPLIDLTTDTAESPASPVPSPGTWSETC